MRIFLVVLSFVILAALIGLVPQPLYKPDWRSPYEAAIEENDCEKIERFIDLLFITGLEVEGHAEAFKNHQAQRCKYADLSAEEVEFAEILGFVGEWSDGRTYFNNDIWSSKIGRQLRMIRREKFPATPFVRNRERAFIGIGSGERFTIWCNPSAIMRLFEVFCYGRVLVHRNP